MMWMKTSKEAYRYVLQAIEHKGNDPETAREIFRQAKDETAERRERIATAALQGILANAAIASSPIGMVDAVSGAVKIADKLIAALDAKPESEEE